MVNKNVPMDDQSNVTHDDTREHKSIPEDDIIRQMKTEEAAYYERLYRENTPDYETVERELMPNRRQRRAMKKSVDNLKKEF